MTLDISIIARVLPSLMKPTANWVGKKMIGEEILERRELQVTALEPVLQKAADEVAETIEQVGDADIDQICLFLTSNEAEAIVRQIYAVSILESKEQNLEEIKQEFLKEFSLYTNIPENELEDSAPQIFNTLVAGCEEALQVAIDRGRLSAHEAKSVFRHQVLLDEIATIKKNLEFLTTSQQLNIRAILRFEEQYRQQIETLHGKLTPPYIDVAKKLPIDQLYVCPNFSQESLNRESREKSKNQQDFYQLIHRTVLLGNPGGGKSTCAQKFCYDLVTQYKKRLLGGRQVTPILVILRDYGAKKKEINCSLLEFIELTAKTKYQLDPPSGAFSYLLLNGHISVTFDGLDELTETSYRQQIRDDVELFCNLYPSVPVLITSREVGYKEAPLDESKFEVYRLAPFDNQQTEEYVTQWFAIDKDLTQEQQSEKVKAFLAESENLTDLRSNPLMLGLMCNIYKGEGYIPRNRPDVYAKCAEMLFERWDRGRDIQLPSLVKQIESKIKPLMMYLANWIYTDESLQSGVTEKKLIAKAADYLCEKRFEDRDDAECAAQAFVNFCRGRAWVFTNVGTNKFDEELYQFNHRTFLEYFTAAYLNRIYRTPDKLFNILLPRIAQQEWDVVSQLAFQIQNKNSEDAGDELLTYLLKEIEKSETNKKWNLIFFVVRCLEFIIPTPKVTKNIVTISIEECLKFGLSQFKYYDEQYDYSLENKRLPLNSICFLEKSADENIHNIILTIQETIIQKINSSRYEQGALVLELFILIDHKLVSSEFIESIEITYKKKIEKIAQQDIFICNLFSGRFNQRINILVCDIVKWHGIEELCYICDYRIATDSALPSIFFYILDELLNRILKHDNLQNRLAIDNVLFIGNFLLNNYRFPINIKSQQYHHHHFSNLEVILQSHRITKNENQNFRNAIKNDYNVIFGIYIIFALFLEAEKDLLNSIREWAYQEIKKNNQITFFQFIRYTFLARFEASGKYDSEVEEELNKCNFNQQQRDFIWKWIRREIDLVAIAEEDEEK